MTDSNENTANTGRKYTTNPNSSESSQIQIEMGLGISRTNADSYWNPVSSYNAFHRFLCCGKRFVGSTVNVILTRQTCGQRSSRAAESKRRANLLYFTFFLLAKRELLRNGDFQKKTCYARRKNHHLALCSGFLVTLASNQ